MKSCQVTNLGKFRLKWAEQLKDRPVFNRERLRDAADFDAARRVGAQRILFIDQSPLPAFLEFIRVDNSVSRKLLDQCFDKRLIAYAAGQVVTKYFIKHSYLVL